MKIFLAVVVAFAAAMIMLFVAPFVVPSKNYKQAIVEEIRYFADADVTIDSFRFQFLPYPAFTIYGLTVSTTKVPFKGVPIFHAAAVQGGLSPGPLFRGKIVTDLTIKNATFDYRVASDNTTNVSLLAHEKKDAKKEKKSYEIRSLLVNGGIFRYMKEGDQNPFVVSEIEFAASDLKFGQVFSASVRLSAAVEKAGKQSINLSGQFVADTEQKIVQAKQADLFYGGSRFGIDGSYKYDVKSFDVHVATTAVTLQSLGFAIPSLAQGLPFGAELTGPFALDAAFNGTKENLAVKCHIDATAPKFRIGSIFNKESNRPFKIIFSGTYQPTHITVEDAAFSIGESAFHLTGSVVNQPGYPAQLALSSTAFDAGELKGYFPFLTIFDELATPAIAINVSGPLTAETGRTIAGHVSAARVSALAHTLSNFETDFQYASDAIILNALKGILYDGALSGNGSIDLKSIPTFHFELVADNLDTAKIPTLPAIMTGIASLVLKADASGTDNVSVRESFSSEGTLVMGTGQIAPLKVGAQILTQPVWKALESYVTGGLDVAARDGLSALEGDVKDLKASFNFKEGTLNISKIEWSHPQYRAEGKGTITLPGEVSGDGDIYISKDTTALLIKDPASRKGVATADGTLDVPFSVSGTLMAMSVKPDEAKFADNLKRTATPAAAAATTPAAPTTPAPATTPTTPAAPTPATPAAPAVKKAKPKPAAEAPAPTTEGEAAKPAKKKVQKETTKGKMSSDVDEDTMKVIIGQ